MPCPVPLCRTDNAYEATDCGGCGTPLFGYARLHAYPAFLFNQGLAAAREDRLPAARDCFAAVVHWCPGDTEARNALALACLRLGDPEEARRQWAEVLDRRPDDDKARRGLSLLGAGPPDRLPDPGTG
ncbi:tetratricopeptide repeat protein [Streptomyces litchfieldiae]|uniref:Tetratricopeptide repeat protein n=1 Tax=Streptomyces litchfieldiae TaxID=3075543 RepID=A0ABU2MK47_9ACTN|nr:tetratricopeptide repeat protein [Streptomyces sp. DSM 44938]MDT0341981.1 tetratricopeptide repeat protein [Streptomyces sp. DSM 44938]